MLLVLGWGSLASVPAVAADPARTPVDVLAGDKGLHRHANGTVWISRHERRLRERLAGLDEARANIMRLQAALDERLKRNAALWKTSREQLDLLQKARNSLKSDDPKRKQLERQIEEVRRQAVEPKQLGGEPDVRARLIELTTARHRLLLSVLGVRMLAAQLDGDYQRLAQDPEVVAALQQLGGGHRLGPLNTNYRAELQRLSEYERVVFTDWSPLYLQGPGPRFEALLNDQAPVAFSWRETSEPCVLTAGLAEAAGLRIPPDAPTASLVFPPNRRLTTRAVTIPTLRIGKYVIRDVPAQVLPPEGEDLGAYIGPLAFPQHRVALEPERLRVVVQPK